MSEIAINIEGLSKRYRIGVKEKRADTLFGAAKNLALRPFRNYQRLRDLTRFDDDANVIWALRDVTFDIAQGDVVGIIGRNGAGKSTMLKILSRITEPTLGRAVVHGKIASLLEVGTGFHPELTGRDNTYLNGTILGMKKDEIDRKFDEIVEFSGVEKFIDTPVKFYSSGMRVRLAFAVAAHLEPEILVIDEVLAVGDAEFQRKCLGKMQEVGRGGRTVLFVSHNMNAVEQLCNTAVIMEKGRMTKMGHDVRTLISDYLRGGFGGESTEEEWKRGDSTEYDNEWFTPIRMTLCDDAGAPQPMPVDNNSDLWVELEFELKQLDPALIFGYALYTDSGMLLYWSYMTDEAEERWPKLTIGRNIIRSRLPKRLLNEGTYRLEMGAGLYFRQWILEPGVHAPSVLLTIQGNLSDSPYWMGKRPGLLAPVFDWQQVQQTMMARE